MGINLRMLYPFYWWGNGGSERLVTCSESSDWAVAEAVCNPAVFSSEAPPFNSPKRLGTVWQACYLWLCSPIQLVAFSFSSWFPLLCRIFLVWWSLICLILLLFLCLRGYTPKEIAKSDIIAKSQIISYQCFLLGYLWFLGITFKSLIHV